jgi:hypothetical protein
MPAERRRGKASTPQEGSGVEEETRGREVRVPQVTPSSRPSGPVVARIPSVLLGETSGATQTGAREREVRAPSPGARPKGGKRPTSRSRTRRKS